MRSSLAPVSHESKLFRWRPFAKVALALETNLLRLLLSGLVFTKNGIKVKREKLS